MPVRELLLEEGATAPSERGILIIDEHGDRKWGERTANVASFAAPCSSCPLLDELCHETQNHPFNISAPQ